jgi:chromosome segregation ATPase
MEGPTSADASAEENYFQESTHVSAAAGEEASGKGMEALVADLQAKLDKLSKNLESSQSAVKQVSKQSGLAQADLNLAKKAADGIAGVKDAANKAIQEAQDARADAESLVETLGSDDVDNLNAKIGEINREYQASQDALATAQQTLSKHQKAGKELELKVVREQEEVDKAHSDITQLPAEVKALTASLKAIARDLAAASVAAQPLRAYVRRSELDAVVERLRVLTSDSHMDGLVTKYVTELNELSQARDELGENEAKLAPLKSTVTTVQADAEKAAAKRRAELENLCSPKKSTVAS